jgi:hypothetical protein
MAGKSKKNAKAGKGFSVVKAVKENARNRVGQPKPARVIEDERRREAEHPRHRPTLGEMLGGDPLEERD